MPILRSRSSPPRSALRRRMPSRMRKAAVSARFGRHDLLQHAEMRPHEVEGRKVADALVELGRALEVGEQEGEARDLEALVDVERIGPVEIAEALVGEEALCGEKGPAALQEMVELGAGDPKARQDAPEAVVLDGQPQRSGAHGEGFVR